MIPLGGGAGRTRRSRFGRYTVWGAAPKRDGRGRDSGRPLPPAQIRTSGFSRIRLLPRMMASEQTTRRTPSSPWDMRWLPCVGRMCGSRTFSLVSGLPSRLSAVGCPPWFEPFIGTTPESDSWPACLWVFWPWPSPTGLPPDCAADVDQVSRFSCMMFPDVRGVSDCAGSRGDFVLAPPFVWS